MLQKRIRELEIRAATLLDEKQKDNESRPKLESDIIKLLFKPKGVKVPEHLTSVKNEHIPKLKGFKLVFKALAVKNFQQMSCFSMDITKNQQYVNKLQ